MSMFSLSFVCISEWGLCPLLNSDFLGKVLVLYVSINLSFKEGSCSLTDFMFSGLVSDWVHASMLKSLTESL